MPAAWELKTGDVPGWLTSQPEPFVAFADVVKSQAAGTVTGWAAISTIDGVPLYDLQGDYVSISELERAAHDLVLDGGVGKAGELHDRRVGDVVESFVLSAEKAKALGLNVDREGWLVTLKIDDPDTLAKVHDGTLKQLSIHGKGRSLRVGTRGGKNVNALSDLVIDEISVVDRGASGNGAVAPSIVLAKRKGYEMSLEEILAKLSEEERQVVLAAIEAAKQPPPPAPAAPMEPMAMQAPAAKRYELPDEIRKQLEEAEVTKREVAALREERLIEKSIERAKTDLAFLPGVTAKQGGAILRAVEAKLDKSEAEQVVKALCAASATIKSSKLFEDLGTARQSEEAEGEEGILAKAKELAQKEGITRAEAVAKLFKSPGVAASRKKGDK